MTPRRPVARATLAAVALALQAGCAAPRIDDNVAAAHADVAAHGGPDFAWLTTDDARVQARADVARRLQQPLPEDDAQRIALSHAPALQALLFDRAAASADATQAARLPNPVFALERLAVGGTPNQVELTRSLTLPLLDQLLLPTRVVQAMGHDLRNMIGVDQRDVVDRIRARVPGYMAMGSTGMGEMTDMAMMPGPPNTAPMMGGEGPYGSLEMGGMFSVVKVRRDQPAGDYRDPGWYKPPAGSTAYDRTGEPSPAASHATHNPSNDVQVQAKKPNMGGMPMEH